MLKVTRQLICSESFYPLSTDVSLLLFIVMPGLAITPVYFADTELARAIVVINTGLILVYLIILHIFIKFSYLIKDTLRCHVSQHSSLHINDYDKFTFN